MGDGELGTLLIGCAIQVHRVLGPGLLESVYGTSLFYELRKTEAECDQCACMGTDQIEVFAQYPMPPLSTHFLFNN